MSFERQIPKLTFVIFFLTFVQSVALFVGKFIPLPMVAWFLPAVTIFLTLVMLRRLRVSLRTLVQRRLAPLALLFLLLGMSFWFNPRLADLLPFATLSPAWRMLSSLTLSLPWIALEIALALFLSLDPARKHAEFLLQPRWLIPLTFLWTVATGLLLTLPVGPLSDDGMVLFMEGGCDWGNSNIFFFAKLGILVAINTAMVVAMQHQTIRLRTLPVFFLTAGLLVAFNVSDLECSTYYNHPQGSLGQMVFEMAAFAILGLSWLRPTRDWSLAGKLWALVAWNGAFVGLFYTYLTWFPHWSWAHTFALSFTLIFIAMFIQVEGNRNEAVKWHMRYRAMA
jgi:hypothetical protein